MRLVTVSVLGTALVAAGMLAPATGEATGHGGVVVEPGMVRPGERVRVSAPECAGGAARIESEVFTGRAVRGAATVKADAVPGEYAVAARCGARKVTGEVRVAGRVGWPEILPADR
ncbi:hypothetical protein SAMN05443665_1002305 [Actinomadura meyerae]|uniref:Uncharacterized protein n=1 Tax=Actinomadura meyerae TaxID=240840 RepID=A0A239DIK1_9ACTN|nr:hypothetical protein [Actinomadura meyerae]SNS31738.1 hypothetical protein SAMN05443665_1002305 [Actinomadura meyerae]